MSAVPHRIGDTVRIVAFVRDGSLDPATGVTVSLKIRRTADGFYWNGSAFVSGVQTVTMTEVSSANEPGYYLYALSTSGFSEGHYTYRLSYTVDDLPAVELNEFLVGLFATDIVSTLANTVDIESKVDIVDATADAIKLKTDNLPTDPADASDIDAATDAIIADTEDIQSRLPTTLSSGRMRSAVESMGSDTITSSVLAASAITEIQAGIATAAALATVEGKIDDIQADVTQLLADVGAIDIPSTNDITAAILAMTTETGLTFKQCMQACFAALAGVLSGADTNTVTIKGKNGSTRITATVDENGNRSAIVFSFE